MNEGDELENSSGCHRKPADPSSLIIDPVVSQNEVKVFVLRDAED